MPCRSGVSRMEPMTCSTGGDRTMGATSLGVQYSPQQTTRYESNLYSFVFTRDKHYSATASRRLYRYLTSNSTRCDGKSRSSDHHGIVCPVSWARTQPSVTSKPVSEHAENNRRLPPLRLCATRHLSSAAESARVAPHKRASQRRGNVSQGASSLAQSSALSIALVRKPCDE